MTLLTLDFTILGQGGYLSFSQKVIRRSNVIMRRLNYWGSGTTFLGELITLKQCLALLPQCTFSPWNASFLTIILSDTLVHLPTLALVLCS